MFDITWVGDHLAVGGALPATNLGRLASQFGIRRVIDVRADTNGEPERLRGHGIHSLHLPTLDFGAVTPEMLDEGVAWIADGIVAGDRVLVHCQLGIGRSVLLILCFLVKHGSRAPDAMRRVKDQRPQASPSPRQIEALLDFEERVTGVRSDFDDVARHAYRHLPNWRTAE